MLLALLLIYIVHAAILFNFPLSLHFYPWEESEVMGLQW
jgi:hypothetical protein